MKHGCTKPRGCLVIEHRLIERAILFIRTYADRCHHGKKEDILFKDLEGRPLPDGEQAHMSELVDAHKHGRILTATMLEAKNDARLHSRQGVDHHRLEHP